jgi:hypothetical protein
MLIAMATGSEPSGNIRNHVIREGAIHFLKKEKGIYEKQHYITRKK